jgi:hypothetical protein
MLLGNVISDGSGKSSGQKLVAARNGATPGELTGRLNWLSGSFDIENTSLKPADNRIERAGVMFVSPKQGDYHLLPSLTNTSIKLTPAQIQLPKFPGADKELDPPAMWQYRKPSNKEKRGEDQHLTVGALSKKA